MMRLLLAVTLFVAACGGGAKAAPTMPSEPTPAPTEAAPQPEPTEGGVVGGAPAEDAGGAKEAPTPAMTPPPAPPPAKGGTRGAPKKSEDPCAGGE